MACRSVTYIMSIIELSPEQGVWEVGIAGTAGSPEGSYLHSVLHVLSAKRHKLSNCHTRWSTLKVINLTSDSEKHQWE